MYDIATYDAKGPAPGTKALWEGIRSLWPQARFLGIYAARTIRGADRLSLHAEGRAVDFVPPDGTRDTIAEWIKERADALGIQEIIIYETRRIWTSLRNAEGWRPYGGTHKGLHHLHVGQHRKGAGIAGGHYDARIIAQTMANMADEQGLKLWHGAIAAGLVGGLYWLERRKR